LNLADLVLHLMPSKSLISDGKTAEEALKNLRKRVKKIIDRYNMV